MKYKKEQLEFLKWEFGVFFHFGIRTFYEGHRDWDLKEMPLDGFRPANLDCGQWMRVIKKAGAKYAILVCKHHDGFANWPSKYTKYSVAGTPWKNGGGDVVKEFTDACREHGIKIGLYYSPAEFGSKDKKNTDYDEYFINQVSELLTGYGKIDYLWFDGCGSENHKYDTQRIIKVIRNLQPDILIFNMWDPDTRWVGNEDGYAHMPNNLTVDSTDFSVFTEITGIKEQFGSKRFLPAECDFMMRRSNWFYSDRDAHTIKSLDELIGIYYYSVGRGANMLINIGPGRDGLLPEEDSARLTEFGEYIKKAFSDPITFELNISENLYTCKLKEPGLVNHCVLAESEESLGAIEKFAVKAYPYHSGIPVTIYEGRTIGHKAICSFPPFFAKKIEIVIEKTKDGDAGAGISGISLHFIK